MPSPLSPRYAIYYAPAATSRLWRWGCAWLGRDAETGEEMVRPGISGYSDADLAALTRTAARYGFHATLKPPFHLADGASEAQLLAAMEAFARRRTPFAAPPLAVDTLDRFVALRPSEPAPALRLLADACVRDFDRFRAPPTDAEIARRQTGNALTPRQRENLLHWGYPYVFDEWRFHMTLTARLDDTNRGVLQALATHFQPLATDPLHVGGIALFKQDEPNASFRIVARAPFTN